MRRLLTAPFLVAAGLAACNSTSEPVTGARPSSGQITELSSSLQDEVESQVPTFVLGSIPGVPPGVTLPAGCPTISNTTDTDGDGIPDDATLTFANPPCQVMGFLGGTLALTGSVRVQDPSAGNTTSYTLTLQNLLWQYTAPSGGVSYAATRNGTRTRTGTADAVTVTAAHTTARQRLDITAVATITQSLTWNFTADTAGKIQVGQPLPDGKLTVDGTWQWKRSTEDWNLTVTTPIPLAYDADCTTSVQRITAGRILLTGTVAGVPGTLVVQWTGCGVPPNRSWVPAP